MSDRIEQLRGLIYAPLTRQWRLLLELDKHRAAGLAFPEILRIGRCDEQTARFDVDTLTIAGFPIHVRTPKNGDAPRVFLDRSPGQCEGTIFNRQGH